MNEMNNNNQAIMVSDKPKQHFFRASAADFKKIPGSPIAYWFSEASFAVFLSSVLLEELASVKTGMTTADNGKFVRFWYEVSRKKFGLQLTNSRDAVVSKKKWFPYNKGGGFRRWYGLNENVVNWEYDGNDIKSNLDEDGKRKASVRAEEYYFQPSITYSAVTSGKFSARISDPGFLFDSGGSSVFCESESDLKIIGGVFCSVLPELFLSAYNDTINFQPGDISRVHSKTITL